ncbi:hypothetical protein [Myxococcus sp. AB025B]|uniref:hypothetical protein n=1 Tax=Myxococcus sp. AB025B TaxID=2562794 RepID=UPI001142AB5B|nr:hypothetical protein [Myxococcus sp. AB025B]
MKTTWSLFRNGQMALAEKRLREASDKMYREDPLGNIQDWVWRLAMFVTGPVYEEPFRGAVDVLRKALESVQAEQLLAHYNSVMSVPRGMRYFELMKSYFSAYDEFAQVQFIVTGGVGLGEGYRVASTNFDATRMFYGNAFEVFASQVDILAFLNNVIAGRAFDRFERMTADEYLRLDKSSRFNPFQGNGPLSALCVEADNQIRNASHHGGFVFDRAAQVIRYRSGKGGDGRRAAA